MPRPLHIHHAVHLGRELKACGSPRYPRNPATSLPRYLATLGYDLAVSWRSRLFAFLTLTVIATATLTAQPARKLPDALTQMIDAERAFAARALVVGWKQAFLEYFADDAVGFEGGPGLAKDQIRKNPDPPSDLQLLWEPRYGDVAASGDLGYLTGPVRNIRKSRDNGRPRHSTYASIWKRQRDGSFKVVMDFGLGTPGPASFAPGFTRAPVGNRFSGDYD